MEAVAKNAEMRAAHELGDESFMSAADLRAYMAEMEMANALKEVDAMDRAEKARKELIKTLSTPASLEEIEEIVASVQRKVRSAAQRGATELMVMRFPCALCTDKGRAINQQEAGWEETLTGVPKEIYQLWAKYFHSRGYKLRVQIVDFPGGVPGDVAMTLKWG